MFRELTKIVSEHIILKTSGSGSIITIKEANNTSLVNELTITNVPENAMAFTLDFAPESSLLESQGYRICDTCHDFCRVNEDDFTTVYPKYVYEQLSPYVNKKNGDGINTSCDLVILWKKDKYYCLVADLKSKKLNIKHLTNQLNNSRLFIQYLTSLVNHFYNKSNSLTIIKGVLIADGSLYTLKDGITPNNTKPDNSIPEDIVLIPLEHYDKKKKSADISFQKIQELCKQNLVYRRVLK